MEVINKSVIVKLALCVLLISIVYIIFINITNPKEVKLDDVIVKENKIDKIKTFAVMIQDENGEYTESESSAFPTEGYRYNSDKSGCVNASGNVVENALSYNTDTNIINLKIQGSVNCYVYYDKLYTVTYELNGGEFESEPPTKEVAYGDTYGVLPEPVKDGYTFKGWNGKNLFSLTQNTVKSNRISRDTPANITDESVEMTCSGDNYHYLGRFLNLAAGTYIVSLNAISSDNSFTPRASMYKDNGSGTYVGAVFGIEQSTPRIFTLTNDTIAELRMFCMLSESNVTERTVLFYNIQIEEGSTATEYEPYYIDSDIKVTQRKNHILKAIWEENE